MTNYQENVCCICGKRFTGWGNNPWPLVENEDARCCDACNNEKVFPARLAMMFSRRKEDK